MFSKCSNIPFVFDGLIKDSDNAACCDKFSGVYFNSNDDNKYAIDCFEKIRHAIIIANEEHVDNLYVVCDAYYAVSQLQIGKAAGFDRMTKEDILYAHLLAYCYI